MRRKARERNGLFVAEGVRTVEALLASPLPIRAALTSDQLDRTPRGAVLAAQLLARNVELLRVSEREFLSASDTEQPQGVLAIAEQPSVTVDTISAGKGDRFLVLDGVQDPGNVGTLLRTAAALGARATLVLPGTADPWNAKVVRSAVGMQFTHPTVTCDEETLTAFARSRAIALWGAAADGEPLGELPLPESIALVVGNEGAGLKPSLRSACAKLVAIPMAPGADSLNVAVAAGIILHALRPSSRS